MNTERDRIQCARIRLRNSGMPSPLVNMFLQKVQQETLRNPEVTEADLLHFTQRLLLSLSSLEADLPKEPQRDAPQLFQPYKRKRGDEQSLGERFKQFVKRLDGYESIDNGLMVPEPSVSWADYLFRERTIVAEQKETEWEGGNRLDSILHRMRDEFPVEMEQFGDVPIHKIRVKPGDEEEYWRNVRKITRNVDGDFRLANRQVAATKRTFNLGPEAAGLLILINGRTKLL